MQAAAIPKDFMVCPTPDGQFAEMVGPLYMRRNSSDTSYGFCVEPRHCNVRGNVHGGMLMTLADQILGLTVMEAVGDTPVVTVSLTNEFVSGASVGDWLSGRAEIMRRTSSMFFMRGVIRRGEDVVLTASGVWRYFAR